MTSLFVGAALVSIVLTFIIHHAYARNKDAAGETVADGKVRGDTRRARTTDETQTVRSATAQPRHEDLGDFS
jgi:hypothetical protein